MPQPPPWGTPNNSAIGQRASYRREAAAEIERLRAALLKIADLQYECGDSECGAEKIARAALLSANSN